MKSDSTQTCGRSEWSAMYCKFSVFITWACKNKSSKNELLLAVQWILNECDRNFLSIEFFWFFVFFLVFLQCSKAKFYVLASCNFTRLFYYFRGEIALSSSKCNVRNCDAFLFSVFINDQRTLRLQSEKVTGKVQILEQFAPFFLLCWQQVIDR